MKPNILTLTGPSCAGKSTMEKLLREKHGFVNVISTTTRPMRAGEVDGESYYFVDRATFKDMQERGQLVESVEFNGNFYGVSVQEVERVASYGRPIVLVVEPEGLKQIRQYALVAGWNVFSVFVNNPPSVIARRFLERYTSDFALSLGKGGGEASRKVIDTYSARMGVMLEQEAFWEEACYALVNVNLRRFDESNTDKALTLVTTEFRIFTQAFMPVAAT